MSAADLGAKATARPWRLDTIDPSVIRSVELADRMTHLAACEHPVDAAFIVYAANNIERVEAELAAFLAQHASEGEQ